MKRLVHRWAGQVVHGSINDAKVFLLAGFEVQHLSYAHTGIADQRAARLNHQFFACKAMGINFGQQLLPQGIGFGRHVAFVVNAQASTKIDVCNRYASCFNAGDQL